MEVFGPLQPREWLAILATVADLGLTVYGVWSGRAREGASTAILFRGKRAAVAAAVLGVVLHLLIRYRLSDVRSWSPHTQSLAWSLVAVVRGGIAAWNLRVLRRGHA